MLNWSDKIYLTSLLLQVIAAVVLFWEPYVAFIILFAACFVKGMLYQACDVRLNHEINKLDGAKK